MHNLILGLMASVFACALITNMIKITVHFLPQSIFAHALIPCMIKINVYLLPPLMKLCMHAEHESAQIQLVPAM